MSSPSSSSPFLRAGNEARIGTTRWWGDVIFSADSIYIFQSQPARLRSFGAIFEALADRLLPRHELSTPPTQIPDSVRNHPDWPARDSSVPVLIIPRDSVEFLHHQRRTLELRFIFCGVEIAIPHGRFGGRSFYNFLAASGWPMIWDDRPINLAPDSAATSRAKLRAKPFRTPHISYSLITGGFLFAILPMSLTLLRNIDKSFRNNLYFACLIFGVSLILFGWVALRRGL
jgi:hypothetical protein